MTLKRSILLFLAIDLVATAIAVLLGMWAFETSNKINTETEEFMRQREVLDEIIGQFYNEDNPVLGNDVTQRLLNQWSASSTPHAAISPRIHARDIFAPYSSTTLKSLIVVDLQGGGTKCLETDNDGKIQLASDACGTGSGGGVNNLVYSVFGGTTYYAASSTASDNLSNYFGNGFVSNASSTISQNLHVAGAVSASSSLAINGDLSIFSTGQDWSFDISGGDFRINQIGGAEGIFYIQPNQDANSIVLSNDRVGIFSTTPDYQLSVANDAFGVNSTGAIAAATGITSSGTITFSALDCTGNANGGALTANGSGVISCTDDDSGGGSGVPDVIQLLTGGTKYYAASSTATDNLAWRFNNGFVSGASSTVSAQLNVGTLQASSTATSTIDHGLKTGFLHSIGNLFVDGVSKISTLLIGGDSLTELCGTGITCSGGTLSSSLGTAIDTSEITDDTIAFADVDHTITIGGNPGLAASQCFWASLGIICEGSSADTFETLIQVTNPTADVTVTIPNITGTLASLAGTQTFTGNKTFSGTVTLPATVSYTSNGSIVKSGNHALTLTTSGTTNATFPSGTITLADLGSTQTFGGAKTFSDLTVSDTAIPFSGASTEFTMTGNWTVNTDDLFINKSNGRVGVASTTPTTAFSVGSGNGATTTLSGVNIDIDGHNGTSTIDVQSRSAKGGSIILEDADGAGCTEIYTLDGVLFGTTVTCPSSTD